jgi:hypothetical protein
MFPVKEITLIKVKKTDPRLKPLMAVHYSHPKGFVGRSLCYLVTSGGLLYGAIVGGSATLHLPGRDEFFEIDSTRLGSIINNVFYHVERIGGRYPFRNFTIQALKQWREKVAIDWESKYRDPVIGFESLIELPRTGELYVREGWERVGQTVGYTCKRTAGKGTDSWSGKRVWDTKNLRPKHVFCKRRELCGTSSDLVEDRRLGLESGTTNTSSLLTLLETENSVGVGSWVPPQSSTSPDSISSTA